MGECKKIKGIGFKRDREPFILSNELHYMLKNFCLIEPEIVSETNDDTKANRKASTLQHDSAIQQTKTFKLVFRHQNVNEKKGGKKNPNYQEEAFEKLASQAFLKIRQNADIFINLLVLMLVAELTELDERTIGFVKKALFLNVSEEEATVQFKHTIDEARKQWYRPIDNLFHIINDWKKERSQKKKEQKAKEKRNKKKKSK